MSSLEDEIIIPPNSKRLRHDGAENKNEDRLSHLPDCVLIHVLQFLNTKDAVRTCILSPRFKHLWKHIPTLILHSLDFSTPKIFTKFVSRVFSLRDHTISLHALNFSRKGPMQLPLLKRILKYAISHNIQRLEFIVNHEIDQIPSSIFSCQTLTHLMLKTSSKIGSEATFFPESLNLPALTSLFLRNFAFCANYNVVDPFSTFNKLNDLVLYNCEVRDAITLRISSSTVARLSMYCHHPNSLKIVELCTPSLRSFIFTGVPQMRFQGNHISSVKHVDIDADLCSVFDCEDPAFNLFSWLLDFVGIKSMVLTASTIQVLSFVPSLLKPRLHFLENLKSLKVLNQKLSIRFRTILRLAKLQKDMSLSWKEAVKLLAEENEELKVKFTPSPPLPDGIADFLLQNSPSAKVDILDLSRYPFIRRKMPLA